jgi:hypothetical protein
MECHIQDTVLVNAKCGKHHTIDKRRVVCSILKIEPIYKNLSQSLLSLYKCKCIAVLLFTELKHIHLDISL